MSTVTEVKNCRACGETLPTTNVFSLGNMPVVSFPERPDAPQLTAPLDLTECPRCTLVQLRHTVDPDAMFRNYWYRSGVSVTMRTALKDVVESAQKFVKLEDGDGVMDIGCNDGTLLSFYPGNIDLNLIGYEPSDVEVKFPRIAVVRDYFGCYPDDADIYKIITACGMFYDLSNPGEFLENVKRVLAPGGIFIVQMNYLASMLQNLAVDNIEHEHLAYYTEVSFDLLCEAHGMTVVKVETNDVNGGSIRFYVRPQPTSIDSNVIQFILDEPKSDWFNFKVGLGRMRESIYSYALKSKHFPWGICGASTRGLALLHWLKLDNTMIFACAGDRDPRKHGRFYGSTGIPIVSEREARERCDVMLVLPYHFAKEIAERERDWMSRGGVLIVPLPVPKVITSLGEKIL